MRDALRTCLQIAGGLTEATRRRTTEVARELLDQAGIDPAALQERIGAAIPAEVQTLVDELIASGRANRDLLLGIVSEEVDKAMGRVGRIADEVTKVGVVLETLERRIRNLEVPRPDAAARGRRAPVRPGPGAAGAARPRRRRAARRAEGEAGGRDPYDGRAAQDAHLGPQVGGEPAPGLHPEAGAGRPQVGAGSEEDAPRKKTAAKTTPAAAAPAKKAPAKTAAAKSTPAKKAPAKAAAKKTAPARKAPAKKTAPAAEKSTTAAQKTAAKKAPAAKKTTPARKARRRRRPRRPAKKTAAPAKTAAKKTAPAAKKSAPASGTSGTGDE